MDYTTIDPCLSVDRGSRFLHVKVIVLFMSFLVPLQCPFSSDKDESRPVLCSDFGSYQTRCVHVLSVAHAAAAVYFWCQIWRLVMSQKRAHLQSFDEGMSPCSSVIGDWTVVKINQLSSPLSLIFVFLSHLPRNPLISLSCAATRSPELLDALRN